MTKSNIENSVCVLTHGARRCCHCQAQSGLLSWSFHRLCQNFSYQLIPENQSILQNWEYIKTKQLNQKDNSNYTKTTENGRTLHIFSWFCTWFLFGPQSTDFTWSAYNNEFYYRQDLYWRVYFVNKYPAQENVDNLFPNESVREISGLFSTSQATRTIKCDLWKTQFHNAPGYFFVFYASLLFTMHYT